MAYTTIARNSIIRAFDQIDVLRDLMGSACSNVEAALKVMDKDDPTYGDILKQYSVLYRAYITVDDLACCLS